jgi:hypothetical protein
MNECFKGYSREAGNITGACCCNCEFQRPINAHPWNVGFAKGSIMHQIGWACMVPDFFPSVTFFDLQRKHGMCECHTPRDYSKYSAEHTMEALKNDA